MCQTVHIRFSDAEVRRQAADPGVRQLRDPRFPPLLLRFHRDRQRAAWHIVRHAGGKSRTSKLGNWPDLPVKTALELLPGKLAELTADPAAAVGTGGWQSVGELLAWYAERLARDRSLSSKRKATAQSLITRQLQPRLGSLPLARLDRASLDQRLIWPMQEVRSLPYTRQAFQLLKTACRQAQRLKLLPVSPLAEVVFTDFIQSPITPRDARLRPVQLPGLLADWAARWARLPGEVMLALMMLCHGTRISETRLAKWQDITLSADGEWFIPAEHTKTGTAHRLPLTVTSRALLEAYRARQLTRGYAGAYLFPRGDGLPWSEKQGQDSFERLGALDWSSHDLRKLARTLWADLGVDYLIGELLLNHALDDLRTAYIHTHAQALKRDALDRWHAYLMPKGLSFFVTETTPRRAAALVGSNPAPAVACGDLRESITKEDVRT